MKKEDVEKIIEELKKKGYADNLRLPFGYVRRGIEKGYAVAKKEELEFLNKLNEPTLNEVQMRSMISTKLTQLTGKSK